MSNMSRQKDAAKRGASAGGRSAKKKGTVMKYIIAVIVIMLSQVAVFGADEPRDLTAARDQYKAQQLQVHNKYRQELERMLATHRTRKDDKSSIQVNAELELVKQRIDELSVKVIEGFGVGPFRLGAKRDELIKALGKPDNDPRSQWLKWDGKGIHCIIVDENIGARELRFEKGFRGQLADGVKIGSTEADLIKAFGQPDKVNDDGATKRLDYTSRGITAFLNNGKLFQLVLAK